MPVLPPGNRYEELALSFPSRGSSPHRNLPFFPATVSPSITSNRRCLSHETSNFPFPSFAQKPLKTLPLTSPSALHLCPLSVPKPTPWRLMSVRVALGAVLAGHRTEQPSAPKRRWNKKHCSPPGKSRRGPDVLLRIAPETCASCLTFQKNCLKYQHSPSITSNFFLHVFIAALGEKEPLSGLTLELLEPTDAKAALFSLQVASWRPFCCSLRSGVERTLRLLAAGLCSYPHWLSPFFVCLSFLSSQS